MNRTMIYRHNERVKPGHTVFHLGDFRVSGGSPNVHELMAMLNGNHVFIRGNHDKNNGLNTPLRYCVIETYGQAVVLAHRPEDAEIVMAQTGIRMAFCGHVHEKWKFSKGTVGDLINVGVDVWDFYPVDAKQIFKAFKNRRIE